MTEEPTIEVSDVLKPIPEEALLLSGLIIPDGDKAEDAIKAVNRLIDTARNADVSLICFAATRSRNSLTITAYGVKN